MALWSDLFQEAKTKQRKQTNKKQNKTKQNKTNKNKNNQTNKHKIPITLISRCNYTVILAFFYHMKRKTSVTNSILRIKKKIAKKGI